MTEVLKFLGAIVWLGGAALLFVEPLIGGIVLVIALLTTLYVRSNYRKRKHAELIQASERAIPTAPPPSLSVSEPSLSVSERLSQLDWLKDSGAITDEEYEVKRQEILGSL